MKKTTLLLLVFFNCTSLIAQGGKMDTTKTTIKIGMTSVFVNSPVEAFKFYTETLGFIEVMYEPEAYIAIVASPRDRDGTAVLLEPNGNPIAKKYQQGIYKQGLPVLVLSVEDIQYEYERLKKLGVHFKQKPTETEWGIVAIFDDTCGNYLQLHQAK